MSFHRRTRTTLILPFLAVALCAFSAIAGAQSQNPKDLAVGKLLVARAHEPDGRFRHAVVLLVGLSKDGEAAGLVLNQPEGTRLSKVFPSVASAQGRTDVAYAGGPVDPGKIFCLLRDAGPLHEAGLVLPGIYVSDDSNLIEMALNAEQPAASFRVFQGYAGWATGQLPRELAAGRWTIMPATVQIIFDPDPATLWARLTAPPAGKSAAKF